jgi:hypothetical protein
MNPPILRTGNFSLGWTQTGNGGQRASLMSTETT